MFHLVTYLRLISGMGEWQELIHFDYRKQRQLLTGTRGTACGIVAKGSTSKADRPGFSVLTLSFLKHFALGQLYNVF